MSTATQKFFTLVKKAILGPQMVPFGQIYWADRLNGRLNYPEANKLLSELSRGWQADQNIQAMKIDDLPADCPHRGVITLDFAMEHLTTLYNRLKDESVKDSEVQTYLAVWERFHTIDGKLIEPIYIGNSGFRRGRNYAKAQSLSFKAGNSLVYEIPVTVFHFDSESDRLVLQIQENDKKDAGREGLADVERLIYAKSLFDTYFTEARFREIFKVGEAQRLFAVCKVNKAYPDTELFARLTDPQHERKLTYPKMNKEKLRMVTKPDSAFSTDDVEAIITEMQTGGKVAPKSLSRNDTQTLVGQTANKVAAFMGKEVVLANKVANMSKVDAVADVCNMAFDMFDAGKYDAFLTHCKAFQG